jgi:uncharacterized protein YjbI with pentapeptide repeats
MFMPKIKLSGQVMDEIYNDAVNLIPNGGRFVAATYLSNPEKRCGPKEAFEKTMAQMRHMVQGSPQDYLKAATAGYLQNHYGFPAADMRAYEFKTGRDSITLRPVGEQAIPFTGWLNRLGFGKGQTTLSGVGDIRGYTQIAPDELMRRLDEHNKWLSDRQQVLTAAKDLFRLDDAKLAEFMKTMPAARLDLSGCEIKNMDFRSQNLDGVSFKNARLDNCAFSHAQGADFSGAAIERCRFEQGDLSFSDFRQSRQNDVRFENCVMQQTDFTDARMKQVTFSGCDLRAAIFNGIDLNTLRFEQPEPVHEQTQAAVQEQAPRQEQAMEQAQTNAPEQGQTRTQTQAPAQTADINIQYAEPAMRMQQY